jgi:predicted dinucleotide-binding enzyme
MDITVIGTGQVGAALGSGWAKARHRVTFASRDPGGDKVRALLASAGPNASAATPAEAVTAGDVVLLAVPWSAVRETLAAAGDLSGKVLIDATNAIGPNLTPLFAPPGSAAAQVAAWAPGARVVKAFNTTGYGNMAAPVYDGQPAMMLYCGDDDAAKGVARGLVAGLGFEPVDAGPLDAAVHLEALALVWIHLARRPDIGRDIAFRLLRR